ncbi:hypothetical protein BDV18DRAFT_141054 [Aspergillus unguis]
MFFAGSLQEGIALAVQESKAVICFVPDDGETSSTWEEDYFKGDEQFTQLLETKSVLLRIAKDSPEAGFLASVCPVTQYPTIVIIRNGMLREYILSGVSKDEFRNRIAAVIDDSKTEAQASVPSAAQQASEQAQETTSNQVPAPQPPAAAPAPSPTAPVDQSSSTPKQYNTDVQKAESEGKGKRPAYVGGPKKYPAHLPQTKKEEQDPQRPSSEAEEKNQKGDTKGKTPIRINKSDKPAVEPSSNRSAPVGPPAQYRLQVRLFDGSSVRSTFAPSHTIRKDVRSWLDTQLEEKTPYNFKLILSPLPNKTLTLTEEDCELRELITGSTATFVLVPIRSYIEAYSDSGSLPVRAASFLYGLGSSAVGGILGYAGSFLGYAQSRATPSQSESSQSSEPQSSGQAARRPRPWGAHIRTLGDQSDGQDSQLYNGNQLNFEPRQDDRR